MASLDPVLKWGMPLVICVAALLCFAPWIQKSAGLRWLYAIAASLLIAPVGMPGCPGFSMEPSWYVVASFWSWDFVGLLSVLPIAAMFLALPVAVVALVIRVLLWWMVRASALSKSGQTTP